MGSELGKGRDPTRDPGPVPAGPRVPIKNKTGQSAPSFHPWAHTGMSPGPGVLDRVPGRSRPGPALGPGVKGG